eukprot:1897987-Pyramimonas_sp.AAC.1
MCVALPGTVSVEVRRGLLVAVRTLVECDAQTTVLGRIAQARMEGQRILDLTLEARSFHRRDTDLP